MNFDFQEHLPHDFADTSRVWIYQSSRLFFISEALEMEDMLNDFAASWKSHSDPVKGFANLFFGRFIVLMADETATGVSGCSTDILFTPSNPSKKQSANVHRQNLGFIVKDKIEVIP
jgi:hypothetical protein